MPFLHSLLKDLVEKRLWPVALMLVAALAAVPMMVGRAAGPEPATAVSSVAAPAAGASVTSAKASVTLVTDPAVERHDAGRLRDPFKSPIAAKKQTGATAPAGGAGTTKAAASGSTVTIQKGAGASTVSAESTGSTGASSPAPTRSTPTATPKPKTTTPAKPTADDATDTYHVSLRFGVDGGALKTVDDVARLSPLPSVTDPFFVFLGVLQPTTTKAKRAVFLVSSDATPNGDGACHPTQDDCETVELTKGETMFFDYTAPDGTKKQYELELTGIHRTGVATAAKAQAAIARHSAAGLELVRDAATRNVRFAAGARAYRYVPATGLLVRAKRRHVTAQAAAAGIVPGLALLDAADQPGIPVWHAPKR
jgi:hypothetical protein